MLNSEQKRIIKIYDLIRMYVHVRCENIWQEVGRKSKINCISYDNVHVGLLLATLLREKGIN